MSWKMLKALTGTCLFHWTSGKMLKNTWSGSGSKLRNSSPRGCGLLGSPKKRRATSVWWCVSPCFAAAGSCPMLTRIWTTWFLHRSFTPCCHKSSKRTIQRKKLFLNRYCTRKHWRFKPGYLRHFVFFKFVFCLLAFTSAWLFLAFSPNTWGNHGSLPPHG